MRVSSPDQVYHEYVTRRDKILAKLSSGEITQELSRWQLDTLFESTAKEIGLSTMISLQEREIVEEYGYMGVNYV